MLGRTLLQPASPITFGLKAAQWCAAVDASGVRLIDAWRGALVLQFGGAAGTRAALGPHAAAVAHALSARLGLPLAAPWHTNRDRLGGLVAALALHVAALGKIARDVSLLMQAEVGEAAERGGGSSAMPHKRNPSRCAVVLAAATRMPGLTSSFLAGMTQEHERAVGGWHAEWPTIAAAVRTAGAAAAAAAALLEGLTVDAARMRANLDATKGAIFSERAMMRLTPALGRETAHDLIERALEDSRAGAITFAEALARRGEAAGAGSAADLQGSDRLETDLAAAEAIRRELLQTTLPPEME
jgi:3-carboxy-cis,cis-muconate cycloisomerase